MDSVNDAETPEGQTADLQSFTHRLPNTAQEQAKSCPLCRTLNHPFSRDCYNCGWRGVAPARVAAVSGSPQRLLQTWLVFFLHLLAWFKEKHDL